MITQELFIDGRHVPGAGAVFDVENPATEEPFAQIAGASPDQVEAAIMAARNAFDGGPWPLMSAAERVSLLGDFADALDDRRDLLIETVIAEAGIPRSQTEAAQVRMGLDGARQIPEIFAQLPAWEHTNVPLLDHLANDKIRLSLRRYEPVGVVAAITPFNFPFGLNVWKAVPALAVGCTVVLRPSPLTPLSALVMADAALEVGFPPGVFNVIPEAGAEGAELLTRHPAVDLVSFTGSSNVGRRIASQAGSTLKRTILELGGKSVQLHLPDMLNETPERVVQTVLAVFRSQAGQACSAQTRVLLPEAHKAKIIDALAEAAPTLEIGDPQRHSTVVGPLITATQRAHVETLLERGVAAGGRIAVGGVRPDQPRGWYYSPTVVDIDDNANPVAQVEVFGPVVTVQGYRSLDQAIAIANDSEYGLSGAVYTHELSTGLDIAGRIRSGTVQVNQGWASSYTPMGGYKQSGIGRERGELGLRAFQEIKHVVVGTP